MDNNRVMTSDSVNGLLEDNEAYSSFLEESIELFRKMDRPFLICSRESIPATIFTKDEKGIWVALVSEIPGA